MEEIWRDIKFIDTDGKEYDYEGLYQVSNLGRVRSLDRIDCAERKRKGKVLKCKPNNNDGYMSIRLNKDGRATSFRVHRLVAHMFIPNPNNYPIINHLDENPSNCNVDNLEWCTQKYNAQYSAYKQTGDKNPKARKVICLETKQIFNCTVDASEWCHGNVSMCCRGRSKTAGGYHWQFLDDYLREQRMQSDINNSKQLAV